MNTTNGTTAGLVACGDSAGNPRANWASRAIGFLYLALGAALVGIGWLLSENPGIFNARSPRYEPPHACACLECGHGYVNGPNGELHCAKYPPKAFLDAHMSASAKQTRLTLGAACGIVGLGFAVLTLACSFLWLLGLWKLQKPVPWYAVACLVAPIAAICSWITAGILKAVYPLSPM